MISTTSNTNTVDTNKLCWSLALCTRQRLVYVLSESLVVGYAYAHVHYASSQHNQITTKFTMDAIPGLYCRKTQSYVKLQASTIQGPRNEPNDSV
jgi:hypothetical protein